MDKRKLLFMLIGTITLLIGAIIYFLFAFRCGKFNLGTVLTLAIPLIVIVFMAFFVFRRYRDIKAGMPLEDERSKRVVTVAAAKSFYFSLYWLLAIMWFEGLFADMFGVEQMDVGQALALGIAGMALLFFGFWLYCDRKGKLS